jgi:GNAT superfamily N-acetyltransferase
MGEGPREEPDDAGTGDVTRPDRAGDAVGIGPLRATEVDALHRWFAQVVADKEGYPHAPPLSRADFDATWVTPTVAVGARVERPTGAELVGAYYLRPNSVGRAAHIANAGYVVAAPWRRRGIGRLLVEDSVTRAPQVGFDAIQFNLVFVSNPARALYEELGWREIGRVPEAVEGEDALIYWRRV